MLSISKPLLLSELSKLSALSELVAKNTILLRPNPVFEMDNPHNNIVNKDPRLRKNITEYIYKKIKYNWIQYHYTDLYDFIIINEDIPMLINNINQLDDNTKNKELKYNYILKKYLSKSLIYDLLQIYVYKNNINWWDIKSFTSEIRHFIHKKVKRLMEKDIYKKMKKLKEKTDYTKQPIKDSMKHSMKDSMKNSMEDSMKDSTDE